MNKQMRSLRELMDERDVRYQQRFAASQEALAAALSAAEKAVAAALLAADRAVTKAELASEKRFESVNEFRQALSDQAAKMPTRIEVDQRISNLSEAVSRLEKAQATQSGAEKKDESSTRTLLSVGAMIVAIAIATVTIISRLPHSP